LNYFSHLYVARLAGRLTPAEALGTVLPDLLPGWALNGALLPADVLTGRALHHQADHAFHRHPQFMALNQVLRAELARTGLATGPTRACAHVGTELLLDATLEPTDVAEAFAEALEQGHLVRAALSPALSARWEATLVWARYARPGDFADPDAVAERLFTVLARRRQLAFSRTELRAVADALGRHQPRVIRDGPGLLADVVRSLGPRE
jgi:hypothetical protein